MYPRVRMALAVLVFALFPIIVMENAWRQFQALEAERTQLLADKRLEGLLSRIKELDDDQEMLARAVRRVWEQLPRATPRRRRLLVSRLRRIFPGQIDLFVYGPGSRLVKELSSSARPVRATEKAFQALRQVRARQTLSVGEEAFLHSFFQAPVGQRVGERTGRLFQVDRRDRDALVIWDTVASSTPGPARGGGANLRPGRKSRPLVLEGYLAFFHPVAMPPDRALTLAVRRLNRRLGTSRVGFCDLGSGGLVVTPSSLEDDETRREILATVARYNQHFTTSRWRMQVRVRDSSSYYLAAAALDQGFPWSGILLRFAFGLWFLMVVSRAPQIREGLSFRIPTKLMVLFLFGVGLPSLLLLSTGYVALKDKTEILRRGLENQILNRLSQFDARFPEELLHLEQWAAGLMAKARLARTREEQEGILEQFLARDVVGQVFLVASSGPPLYEVSTFDLEKETVRLFHQIARGLIRRATGAKEDLADLLLQGVGLDFGRYVQKLGRMVNFALQETFSIFWLTDFVTVPGRSGKHLLMLVFYKAAIENAYCLKNFAAFLRHEDLPLNFTIKIEGADTPSFGWVRKLIPAYFETPFTEKLVREARFHRTLVRTSIGQEGEETLWVALHGVSLDSTTLLAWTSLAPLHRKIREQWMGLWAMAGLVSLAALVIGLFLAEQFLSPLADLHRGVLAIGRRDFQHRLPVHSLDELGELSSLLNTVLEGMNELEIARIVQEDLFPKGPLRHGSYEIYGRSRSMRDIGGDYFDFFPQGSGKLLGLIGDVSGHGIGAALLMGVAKGVLNFSFDHERSFIDILSWFNRFLVERVRGREIMTLFLCEVDLEQHELRFANAGHLYPFLWSPRTGLADFLVPPRSVPLGAFAGYTYRSAQCPMAVGDTLLLYTDGLVEAVGPAGQVGFDRLQEWFTAYAHLPVQEVVDGVFREFESCTSGAEFSDDVTLVCLKRLA